LQAIDDGGPCDRPATDDRYDLESETLEGASDMPAHLGCASKIGSAYEDPYCLSGQFWVNEILA